MIASGASSNHRAAEGSVAAGATPKEVFIRPYRAADRAAVREVCYRTGYLGRPIDWQWFDSESFADMFSGYYTDREPASAMVVEIDGVVSGYLLGCVDSERAWSAGAVAARHILRRGIAFRPGTAGVIWRTIGDGIVDVARRRIDPRQLEFADPRWPAHFHVDLLERARGLGAGRRLVQRWLESLQDRGVHGCHAQTFAENTGALAFFEATGFRRFGEPAVVQGLRSPAGARLHTQVVVRDLV
jgi:GNAT superfamily N-acetyltransferase